MYRVIIADEITPFGDLGIRTYRLHTDYAPTPLKTCDNDIGEEIRNLWWSRCKHQMPEIRMIDIDSLVTDQQGNSMIVLREMYESAPSIHQLQYLSSEFPLVVRYQGVNYLLDGNTRTVLIYTLGGKSVKCRFYNLDGV